MRERLAELQAHDSVCVAFQSSNSTSSTSPVPFNRETFAVYVFPWPSDGICEGSWGAGNE
jgi:hypothetical protein